MRFDVATYLKQLSTKGDLFYRPNPGNAGDSLIACATFQLFEKENISYRLFDDDSFDPAGKIVVYGGGGSFVSEHIAARRFVERYHQSAAKLVLLPHTVSGNEELLGKLGPNVDVITREVTSFEYVNMQAPHANVFLANDLAFGLDVKQVLAMDCSLPYRHIPLKRIVRRDATLLRESACRSFGKRVLCCFRTDKERTEIHRPLGNTDVSKLFKCGTEAPLPVFCATSMVFRLVAHYEEVRTNRLHVAIAGALLGKRVTFYPNSYFKNEAVYNYSMKERFPNVQWMGRDSA